MDMCVKDERVKRTSFGLTQEDKRWKLNAGHETKLKIRKVFANIAYNDKSKEEEHIHCPDSECEKAVIHETRRIFFFGPERLLLALYRILTTSNIPL